MISKSSKSQRKKIISTFLILGVCSVLIFIYKNSPPVLFVEGIVQTVFSGPKAFLYSVGKEGRSNREAELEKKIRALEQKITHYETIKNDNEALRSQFLTSGETSQSLVAAKIIGFQGDNSKPSQFVINVGQDAGIQPKMTVIFEKYLVGRVETVTKNYSVVISPFNPKFQVLARVPETNANGIVIGRSDLMLFDGVLITDSLKQGEVVVTKGEVDKNGIGVVPDIIIGKITSISKRETAPFQSAQIVPLVMYEKLTNVFVISKM